MNDSIKAVLTNFVNLTDENGWFFHQLLLQNSIKKGVCFFKENDYCDQVGFVNKGFFNFFYLIKGVEHVRGFFTPNSFISNYPCFLLNNKSKFDIKALEDSSVTLIHRDALFLLYKQLPKVQELSRSIIENLYIKASEKYESFFLKTAEEHYLDLLISELKVIEKPPPIYDSLLLRSQSWRFSRIKNRIAKK